MKARRAIALALGMSGLTAVCVLVSCQVILGVDAPVGREPEASSAEAATPPPRIDPCAHANVPAPPIDAPAGKSLAPLWFVMNDIRFPLIDDAGVGRGYDLDNGCTCADDLFDGAPSCKSFVGIKTCDPAGGVDNTFANALAQYSAVFDINAATNRAAVLGRRSVLIYLTNYNGLPNDPDVQLALVPSDGHYSDRGCNEVQRPDAGTVTTFATLPPWNDGCDHWSVKEGFLTPLADPPTPLVPAGPGYVKDGVLVAASRGVSITLLGRLLSVSDGVFTARLEKFRRADGVETFKLTDGIAAGRAPLADFTNTIANARTKGEDVEAGNQPTCQLGPAWTLVKKSMCEALDMSGARVFDFQDKTCDAFSMTWGFGALPILIDRTPHQVQDPPQECPEIKTPQDLCDASF